MAKKLKAGEKIGQWTLVGDEELGKGGNGTVWEVVNDSQERGALKILHKHLIEQAATKPESARRVKRFLHEIQFMRRQLKAAYYRFLTRTSQSRLLPTIVLGS